MDVTDVLRSLEECLLNSSVRKDGARVASMLSEEFREFGASGRVYRKGEIVAALQAEAATPIVMEEFQVVPLTVKVALVTYRAKKGATESLRSSIWALDGESWRMLFHQGTRISASAELE